ncbi:septum formation family protein [Gulosibacter molinativorax]|uniref:septum formation family protein n=1 Tax=Gulosibacter molinativorax TaxID=256821 RepID=UPI000A027AD4|nr:septum formation family protein [Gulosibacter molinativorax]
MAGSQPSSDRQSSGARGPADGTRSSRREGRGSAGAGAGASLREVGDSAAGARRDGQAARRQDARRHSPLGRNLAICAVIVLAAGVAGWIWSPFGRAEAPNSAVPATTQPAASTLATLEAGDCFATLETPWASDFAPISCDESHTAQLTAIVPVESVLDGEAWPGEDALRERAMIACQSPDAINLDAAASIPDLQVQVRWPADEVEWDAGIRSYYCFATSAEQFDSLQP